LQGLLPAYVIHISGDQKKSMDTVVSMYTEGDQLCSHFNTCLFHFLRMNSQRKSRPESDICMHLRYGAKGFAVSWHAQLSRQPLQFIFLKTACLSLKVFFKCSRSQVPCRHACCCTCTPVAPLPSAVVTCRGCWILPPSCTPVSCCLCRCMLSACSVCFVG
jgi:hypothetical protein